MTKSRAYNLLLVQLFGRYQKPRKKKSFNSIGENNIVCLDNIILSFHTHKNLFINSPSPLCDRLLLLVHINPQVFCQIFSSCKIKMGQHIINGHIEIGVYCLHLSQYSILTMLVKKKNSRKFKVLIFFKTSHKFPLMKGFLLFCFDRNIVSL